MGYVLVQETIGDLIKASGRQRLPGLTSCKRSGFYQAVCHGPAILKKI